MLKMNTKYIEKISWFCKKRTPFYLFRFRSFFLQFNSLLVWKTNLLFINILNISIDRDIYGLGWDFDLDWPHLYPSQRTQVHTIMHTAHVQTSATNTGALHRKFLLRTAYCAHKVTWALCITAQWTLPLQQPHSSTSVLTRLFDKFCRRRVRSWRPPGWRRQYCEVREFRI